MSAPILNVTTDAQEQIYADAIETQPTTPFVAADVGKTIQFNGTEWELSDATDLTKGATSAIIEIEPFGQSGTFRRAKQGDLVTYAAGGLTPGDTLYETGTAAGVVGSTVDAAALFSHAIGEAVSATTYVFHPYIATR